MEDLGSATTSSSLGRLSIISWVRWTTHTGWPRHSTVIIIPGSTLDRSTSTGAPAARARALGFMLATKGTATATLATPPATLVAATRKRRLRLSRLLSAMYRPITFQKRCILQYVPG